MTMNVSMESPCAGRSPPENDHVYPPKNTETQARHELSVCCTPTIYLLSTGSRWRHADIWGDSLMPVTDPKLKEIWLLTVTRCEGLSSWTLSSSGGIQATMATCCIQPHVQQMYLMHLIKCWCSTSRPCSTGRCRCVAVQMSCSMFCTCNAG